MPREDKAISADAVMSEPPVEALRDAVLRATVYPHFAQRYAGLLPVRDHDDFRRLPYATRADLAGCVPDLWAAVRRSLRGTYVFSSGGTTGSPKLSFLSRGFFLDEIVRAWAPLGAADVLLNLYAPGRMWSAHYFYNELATRLGAATVPVGTLAADELRPWLRLAEAFGVTAIGATPTTLRQLLEAGERAGAVLPEVRSLLWVGEPLDAHTRDLARRVLPQARPWGLYGSTETWVIAANGPGCDPAAFHPLPHQYVELGEGQAVAVTTLHPDGPNPIVRYLVGDRGAWRDCRCGRAPALAVHQRIDEAVKFRGSLLTPHELVELARHIPGVLDAQVVLLPGERLELRCVLDGRPALTPEEVRDQLVVSSLELDNLFDDDRDAFLVRFVPRLETNRRTGKTPRLVRSGDGA